ncbi:WxcM-like domain-containing protein [Mycetohabitans endofungorum]|uniref:sugar 3,4-ketoisomerase n=1 Tax=Mycetohabitans endofungorum TaxID=417203 RepID=UPI0030CAE3D1
MANIRDCKIIEFARFHDSRGAVTPIEATRDIPFDIKRVYYLYDIPSGSRRAGHAHVVLQQVLIAISGSFKVHVDDGTKRKAYELSSPRQGLYITPMIWLDIDHFSAGAVCAVLASQLYDEEDYIRKYEDFTQFVRRSDEGSFL